MTNPEIYLNAQEKYTYKEFFKIADVDQKSFLAKNEAMTFFSKTGIPSAFLEEIWQTVDQGDKGYITETEFYIALKFIACAQNGVEVQDNVLATQVSLPQFKDVVIRAPTLDTIAPITAEEREKYINVFQSCHLSDGILYGEEARNIFMRSKLSMDRLNLIWVLADTRNSGTLNKTEFIIAMHYISRCMSNPSLTLPQTLPSQTYAEATGRFAVSIRRHNTTVVSPPSKNRTASLLSPVASHSTAYTLEIDRYRPYFTELDTDGSGFIESDEAVYFFSHSNLPDSELGMIWEIADKRQLGKLDLRDFSVAMHLISLRKSGESIDKYFKQTQYNIQSPNISNQQQQNELDKIYELENHLVEVRQQINTQSKLVVDLQTQLEQEKQTVYDLELKVTKTKRELETARMSAEEFERLLELELQKKEDLLLGRSSAATTPNTKMFVTSLPELTRTPSSFSGSYIMSPQSDAGSKSKMSLSPVQAKSVLKYGFDLTAFDTLSTQESNNNYSNAFAKSSVNDDLASLFDFDSIFM
ncbi:hypothetical protein INT48_006620 [Thamnidium elegans]|uniref:Epidermal growth factor receptor substrate 15-like 1 n=1 Tax=Thamnidium elegans TaxID=101142 RepID=A0A8H7VWP0_9FUNG|nr:hypothetical protein INT48_006620 [Thamnidium elegans]